MSASPKYLIVDDDEVVRLSHKRSLLNAHCVVAAAPDGTSALAAMEREPADVVLLDLRMPGQDGLTVLREIKHRWPDSQVVVVTGYASIETAKEAVRLGAYDYLAKPLAPLDLIKATTDALTYKRWALQAVSEREDDEISTDAAGELAD
jgi:DNA-binding NtrC family response regulator